MKETNKIYKLATLYMLSKVDMPITTNRLSFYLLKNNYTDYFTFQQGVGELLNDGWLDTSTSQGKTLYRITPEGRDALSLLSNEISEDMKRDIESYIKETSTPCMRISRYSQNIINMTSISIYQICHLMKTANVSSR